MYQAFVAVILTTLIHTMLHVSLSQQFIVNEVYSIFIGTQDRVVLIQGTAEGLMKVQNTIIEKVYEFPVPKDLAAIIGDRPKQVSFCFV